MRGFTLIEMLLSVALLTVIVGISIPIYESTISVQAGKSEQYELVTLLRLAQTYSRARVQEDTWSVHFKDHTATLFAGNSFGVRDVSKDFVIDVPHITFLDELVVSFDTIGNASSTEILLLSRAATSTIFIQEYGVITQE